MTIDIKFSDDIAVITIDDGKVNAFDVSLLEGLRAAIVSTLTAARAIVVTGRPGVFSAGLDLNVVRKGSHKDRELLFRKTNQLLTEILDAPIPIVAASTGHALALGGVILMACDHRIGADGQYRIGVNATANGITLTPGLLGLLEARLPRAYIRRCILEAEIFDPASAKIAGFYDAIAVAADLEARATDIAKRMAALPPAPFADHKRFLNDPVIELLTGDMAE